MRLNFEPVWYSKLKKSKGPRCHTQSLPFVMIPYAPLRNKWEWSDFLMSAGTSLFSGIIVSQNRPRSINHSKQANFKVHQFPGGQTGVAEFGSFSEKKISFEVKFAEKNRGYAGGITTKLKALESLVYPVSLDNFSPVKGIDQFRFERFSPPFTPPPKVLYWWGTGTVFFLPYWLLKLDWTTSHENVWGFPQVVNAKFELLLDEDSALFTAENTFRKVLAFLESVKGINRVLQMFNVGKIRKKKDLKKGSPYFPSGLTGNRKIDKEVSKLFVF